MSDFIPYFDGHNDVLTRLTRPGTSDGVKLFLEGGPDGQLDLPRMREGHMVGGLFALFPPPIRKPGEERKSLPAQLPPMLSPHDAWDAMRAEMAMLFRIVAGSDGQVTQCLSVKDIRGAIDRGSVAVVLHLEGADAIQADLDLLHVLYRSGLRSLGPVWSRETIFATGVPFQFPATPDIGPGLTEPGRDLVRECNRLGIMLDVSHLNEQGFWELANLSDAPIVASHSNVHALCQTPRNLTDKQLDAIAASDGFVGLNLATGFIREDGKMDADTDLDPYVRHMDYLIEKLGEDRVGIGSDFDGAMMPRPITDVAGAQLLFETLRGHGYTDDVLKKIGAENWLAVLERTWGE